MSEKNWNEKIAMAKLVAANIRTQLDALDEELAKASDARSIERYADRIAESAARVSDEISPVRRGKSRMHHVRKALGYTYP